MAKTTIDEVVVVLGRKTDTDTVFHSEKEEGGSDTQTAAAGRLRAHLLARSGDSYNLALPSRSRQPGTGKPATNTNAVGSSGLAVEAKHTTRLVRGSGCQGQTPKILLDLADVR